MKQYMLWLVHSVTAGGVNLELAVIVLTLFVSTVPMDSLSFGQPKEVAGEKVELGSYLASACKKVFPEMHHVKIIAFLLRFEDLGCLSCAENFLELCDSLAPLLKDRRRVCAVITFPEKGEEEGQRRLMTAWAKANDVRIPFVIVPARKYSEFSVDCSSAILVDTGGTVIYRSKMPLSYENEKRLLGELHSR